MDWEQIIDSLMELVKDEETRTEIYKTILEASDDVDENYVENVVHGIDDAFDNAWTLFLDSDTTDEEEDEHEEDDDYEDDSEEGYEYDEE
jgi:hypothetical protein